MYKVVLQGPAEKSYRKIARTNLSLLKRIDAALASIQQDPSQYKPLVGRLQGKWSCRVGDWLIIYSIDKSIVTVYILAIGHRRDIYS